MKRLHQLFYLFIDKLLIYPIILEPMASPPLHYYTRKKCHWPTININFGYVNYYLLKSCLSMISVSIRTYRLFILLQLSYYAIRTQNLCLRCLSCAPFCFFISIFLKQFAKCLGQIPLRRTLTKKWLEGTKWKLIHLIEQTWVHNRFPSIFSYCRLILYGNARLVYRDQEQIVNLNQVTTLILYPNQQHIFLVPYLRWIHTRQYRSLASHGARP